MAIIHEDVQELKKIFDERYVLQADCDTIQASMQKKFANDDTRICLFEQKMATWEWLFKLIATGTIGSLVTSVLNLILK